MCRVAKSRSPSVYRPSSECMDACRPCRHAPRTMVDGPWKQHSRHRIHRQISMCACICAICSECRKKNKDRTLRGSHSCVFVFTDPLHLIVWSWTSSLLILALLHIDHSIARPGSCCHSPRSAGHCLPPLLLFLLFFLLRLTSLRLYAVLRSSPVS